MEDDPRRRTPRTDAVLALPEIAAAASRLGRGRVKAAVGAALDACRAGTIEPPEVAAYVLAGLPASATSLRPVVNATGVLLHTNLGRAPFAVDHPAQAINVEFDLTTGERGSRQHAVGGLLASLCGAEAAIVVNNNAAAVLLVLAALCQGREAIVSRGELVEIGGGFRVPDVMRQSGAILVEVGTTNRTRAFDYDQAITECTGLLVKVHKSNFAQVGFTEEVDTSGLVKVGRAKQVAVFEDLGSGSLVRLDAPGLTREPTPARPDPRRADARPA